jgi:hypothetical protein
VRLEGEVRGKGALEEGRERGHGDARQHACDPSTRVGSVSGGQRADCVTYTVTGAAFSFVSQLRTRVAHGVDGPHLKRVERRQVAPGVGEGTVAGGGVGGVEQRGQGLGEAGEVGLLELGPLGGGVVRALEVLGGLVY